MFPYALVVGIINHLWLPFTLVIWVVDHRCLPFTVVFIVPVIRLFGVWIRNLFRLVVPVVGLLVRRVGDHSFLNPVGRLRCFGILDRLWLQKVKVLVQRSFSDRLVVDKNFESIVGIQNESVEVGQIIGFGGNVLVDKEVFRLCVVLQNDVRPLVGSTNVGAKHNCVRCVASKASRIERVSTGKELKVGTTAVQVLFVLYRVLEDKWLVTAHKGLVELCGKTVKASIL
mmetsp:Transcript_152/g.345  ORF Transcript_152/g.345 Transcript_152/m.345 type:complete len:228 (-) Transcript_152:290-973(-)